ncbi:MAG: LytTR family transcriptional regulator, partial [Chitinophagaceae bacterium]
IDTDQIKYIEADSNYSIFTLKNNEKITVSKVLKDYEEILPPARFQRIHKSTIVNMDHIKEYSSRDGLKVILNSGESFPVSRRRATDFFETMRRYTTIQIEK